MGQRSHRKSRSVAGFSLLLLIAATLLAPAAVGSIAIRQQAASETFFVDAFGALATDAEFHEQIRTEILDAVDAAAPKDRLGATLFAALRPLIATAVDGFVASTEFEQRWRTALASAHPRFIAVLEADASSDVTLDLTEIAAAVAVAISSSGLPGADALPQFDAQLTLISAAEIRPVRSVWKALELAAVALPLLVAVLLLGTVLASRNRIAAIRATGVALCGAMLALAIAAAVARPVILARAPERIPDSVLTVASDAALLGIVSWAGAVFLLGTLLAGIATATARHRGRVERAGSVARV